MHQRPGRSSKARTEFGSFIHFVLGRARAEFEGWLTALEEVDRTMCDNIMLALWQEQFRALQWRNSGGGRESLVLSSFWVGEVAAHQRSGRTLKPGLTRRGPSPSERGTACTCWPHTHTSSHKSHPLHTQITHAYTSVSGRRHVLASQEAKCLSTHSRKPHPLHTHTVSTSPPPLCATPLGVSPRT